MDEQLRMAGTGINAAAKCGVEALTVAAANEYAAQGVRINAIRSGAIRAPMLERNLQADSAAQRKDQEDRYRSTIALRRIGEPSGIADAVVWLCSSRSSHVTGQVNTVDGSLGL